MKRTLSANYIFPVASKPIKNGFVTFDEDGTVIETGELTREKESTEFYNGIICPGMVNAHCHIELSHLGGLFEEKTGMSGFINQINALRESSPKEKRISIMEAEFSKLYAEGVSAMADISNCDESFAMKSASKLYTRTYLEVFGSEPEDAPAVMAEADALKKKANAMGLDAAPTPHSPYTMSPALLEMAAAQALKEGFLTYHNQESEEEEEMLATGTGALAENYKNRGLSTPPVTGKPALLYFLERLKKTHPAPFNESILLVHNTATGEESIDAAVDILKNCTWVTCPLSNLFIHNRLAPLELFRRRGLRIAIGTDSLSSNHVLSMAEEIKCILRNFPAIPLEEVLEWACLNGAIALGKAGTLGSFGIGKRPGAVLLDNIDWSKFSLTPQSSAKRLI